MAFRAQPYKPNHCPVVKTQVIDQFSLHRLQFSLAISKKGFLLNRKEQEAVLLVAAVTPPHHG